MVFRFLDLPAELRNKVYNYMTKFPEIVYITRKSHRQSDSDGIVPPTKWSPYNTLSHVCRQIRREYRDLQRFETMLEVDWDELEAFLDTFDGSTVDRRVVPQYLAIVVNQHDIMREPSDEWDYINILPLLTLSACAYSMNYEFCASDRPTTPCNIVLEQHFMLERYVQELNQIMYNIEKNWVHELRSRRLESVTIVGSQDDTPHISVLFNAGCWPRKLPMEKSSEAWSQVSEADAVALGFGIRDLSFDLYIAVVGEPYGYLLAATNTFDSIWR